MRTLIFVLALICGGTAMAYDNQRLLRDTPTPPERPPQWSLDGYAADPAVQNRQLQWSDPRANPPEHPPWAVEEKGRLQAAKDAGRISDQEYRRGSMAILQRMWAPLLGPAHGR